MKLPAKIDFFLPAILVFLMLFALTPVQAQNVVEGKREFSRKTTGNALSVVVEGDLKNVSDVVEEILANASGARAKGFGSTRTFSNARVAQISNSTMDISYRVEKASKSDPPQTRVTLFLSAGNDNFMDSNTHPDEIANATEMLENLQLEVSKYELGLAIEAQNKVIEKAIKDHEKMVSDSVELEQKLAETIEAIENNKVSRANQLVKIEEEKQNLINLQQTLVSIEQNGLEQRQEKSEQNMEKSLENVARKPGPEGKDEGGEKKDDNN
jgi:predicted DNA-binding ribbon-helix-helix protein